MANITAIYCLKAKKDRTDIEQYRTLVNLINRQNRQGGELIVQGLYEAKKAFRCKSIDPIQNGFNIAKGEYFLLADGKDYDVTHWRLRRACRTEAEAHLVWPLTGIPDNDEVYDSAEPENRQDPELDENNFIRQLAVDLPAIDEIPMSAEGSEDFISVYDIRETSREAREDTWSIRKYTAGDFADEPELLTTYKALIQCDSVESLRHVTGRQALLDTLDRKQYKDSDGIDSHHSLVVAVINGKNNEWRCGLWCYKREKGKAMEIHEVDCFLPDGYVVQDETRLVPYFQSDESSQPDGIYQARISSGHTPEKSVEQKENTTLPQAKSENEKSQFGEIEKIVCPKCRTEFETAFYSLIDIDEDSEAMAQISSFSLNAPKCPHCGTKVMKDISSLCYSLKFEFALFYSSEEPTTELANLCQNIAWKLFGASGDMPRIRIVSSPYELLEKIVLFQNEYSDAFLEAFKMAQIESGKWKKENYLCEIIPDMGFAFIDETGSGNVYDEEYMDKAISTYKFSKPPRGICLSRQEVRALVSRTSPVKKSPEEATILSMENAVPKTSKKYTPIPDPDVTKFWKAYFLELKKNLPDAEMPEPGDKPANSDWPQVKFPKSLPKKWYIQHKMSQGHMDLVTQWNDEEAKDIQQRLDDLRRITLEKVGKCYNLRISVPQLDRKKDFNSQLENVLKCFQAMAALKHVVE